jgi:hypothetical protein
VTIQAVFDAVDAMCARCRHPDVIDDALLLDVADAAAHETGRRIDGADAPRVAVGHVQVAVGIEGHLVTGGDRAEGHGRPESARRPRAGVRLARRAQPTPRTMSPPDP